MYVLSAQYISGKETAVIFRIRSEPVSVKHIQEVAV